MANLFVKKTTNSRVFKDAFDYDVVGIKGGKHKQELVKVMAEKFVDLALEFGIKYVE